MKHVADALTDHLGTRPAYPSYFPVERTGFCEDAHFT